MADVTLNFDLDLSLIPQHLLSLGILNICAKFYENRAWYSFRENSTCVTNKPSNERKNKQTNKQTRLITIPLVVAELIQVYTY